MFAFRSFYISNNSMICIRFYIILKSLHLEFFFNKAFKVIVEIDILSVLIHIQGVNPVHIPTLFFLQK